VIRNESASSTILITTRARIGAHFKKPSGDVFQIQKQELKTKKQ